jgi:hypothetical protein
MSERGGGATAREDDLRGAVATLQCANRRARGWC